MHLHLPGIHGAEFSFEKTSGQCEVSVPNVSKTKHCSEHCLKELIITWPRCSRESPNDKVIGYPVGKKNVPFEILAVFILLNKR